MIYYSKIKIPELSRTILIAKKDKGVCSIEFYSDARKFRDILNKKFKETVKLAPEKMKGEVNQIKEYFSGKRKNFSMKLYMKGTDFQKKVWKAISEIGYGKTKSYFDIAKRIKNINALRAVGTACGKNPLPIVIPCHRVIAKDGGIGGFGGGLPLKRKMLKIEKVRI
jgi:O-6-methylguanine DNA methyltransferase